MSILKNIREVLGLSQSDLAEILNTNQSRVSLLETGGPKARLRHDEMVRIREWAIAGGKPWTDRLWFEEIPADQIKPD